MALSPMRFGILVVLAVLAAALATGITSGSANGGSSVYTLSNATDGNQVLVFDRANDGTLTPDGAVDTGGDGTGSGLGSQGALVVDGNRLLAVNAGSDTISLFSIQGGNPVLRDVVPSGGDMPISLTVHGNVVYVLNAGAPENITGFRIRGHSLHAIPFSTRSLSGSGVGPAQVQFSPNGHQLVVTEKGTNKIDTYFVAFGWAIGPWVQDSVGATPFGFDFGRRGTLIVSEAFGGAADASAVSSYRLGYFGHLSPVTESAPTTETAACWIETSKDGRYAYAANTGSASVTGYSVAKDGSLTILDADGKTGETPAGSKTIDLTFNRNGKFLYALSGGTNVITAFSLNHDGSLDNLGSVGGLPDGTVGLAAN
jgi:6-phosphogluconolactonase